MYVLNAAQWSMIWDMDTSPCPLLKWELSSHHLTGLAKLKLVVAVV